MGKILKLDQHTTNLIAAGEVIERAASVVKELVENAIDAEATKITISLRDAGLAEIVVSDNGIGMDATDAKMCVEPHATSKIKNEHDLFQIRTLGFRGEALPSIVSVSNFKLKTSQDGQRGIMYTLRGGEKISEAMISHPKGTEVNVKSLFFNTPARLQNLQSEQMELSYIVEYVNKMALAMPNISFKLLNNDRIILQTFGNNQLLEVISTIYGVEVAQSMNDIFNDNGFFKISGFISKPTSSRSNKNHIHLIVNKRMIRNAHVTNAIIDAYKNFMMIGRYPIVILNVEIDPSLVDVNVHPAKLEVRFSNEIELLNLIKETIEHRLQTMNLIVDMGLPPQINKVEEDDLEKKDLLEHDIQNQKDEIKEDDSEIDLDKFDKMDFQFKTFNSEDLSIDGFKESFPKTPKEVPSFPNLEPKKEEPILREVFHQQKYTMQEDSGIIDETERPKIPKIDYIGQLHGTYLLGQDETSFYVIDQHAAAERINYEKFSKELKNRNVISYELLIPIKLEYTLNEAIYIVEYIHELSLLGVKLEEFGGGTFMVREVPIWLFRGREKEFIEEIIFQMISNRKKEKHEFLDNLAKSLACKRSIKGNEYINKMQIEYLLTDLEKCSQPYTCPHGRPVIIRFSKTEIEKWFKRIVS